MLQLPIESDLLPFHANGHTIESLPLAAPASDLASVKTMIK